MPQYLSDSEFQALKNLSRLKKEVIIQKSDKGNSVVLVNKSDYIRHIEGILKDVNKFEKVFLKKGNPWYFPVNAYGNLTEKFTEHFFIEDFKATAT